MQVRLIAIACWLLSRLRYCNIVGRLESAMRNECVRTPAGPLESPDSPEDPKSLFSSIELRSKANQGTVDDDSDSSPVKISALRKHTFSPEVKRVAECWPETKRQEFSCTVSLTVIQFSTWHVSSLNACLTLCILEIFESTAYRFKSYFASAELLSWRCRTLRRY